MMMMMLVVLVVVEPPWSTRNLWLRRMTSAATESAELANSVAEANKKRYEEQVRWKEMGSRICSATKSDGDEKLATLGFRLFELK